MSVKITMIGVGYVGLVTGACFAELGHDVICVDKNAAKIKTIMEGGLPIYEPGLDQLVQRNVAAGRLRFTTDTPASVRGRDAVFIAVGTPSEKSTGRADLRYVLAAAAEVGANIEGFTVVVTKSTVPVGTNAMVAKVVLRHIGPNGAFAVASNPEFLREGAAITDFMEPDRIVVGCADKRAIKLMKRIYVPLSARNTPVVVTDVQTAEMIKYAANAFLAVKVSFINEIANLCEALDANVTDVAVGIGLDKRIGASFLRPGPGWGGSCFPKDTLALLTTAQDAKVEARIVEAALTANTRRKHDMVARVVSACGGSVAGKTIGVLGLTFKGQTDDMRDSPSLVILPELAAAGARVIAFDPSNPREAPHLLPEVALAATAEGAARDADALVVMTDWMVFKAYDLSNLADIMREPVMIDLRNLFDRETALSSGFTRYLGIGQPTGANGT